MSIKFFIYLEHMFDWSQRKYLVQKNKSEYRKVQKKKKKKGEENEEQETYIGKIKIK